MCGRPLRVVVFHESREDFRYRVSWHHRAVMRCFPCRIMAETDVPGPVGHWDYVLRTQEEREETARKLYSLFCERWADKVRPEDEIKEVGVE